LTALRWGVLGVSQLVGRLAVLPALRSTSTGQLVAIGSRDATRAAAEAKLFGARRSYGSYEEVLADPDVDAVYIPLPNALHREWTLRAAKAGKHVLCEKPLACTAKEAREMASACRKAGVFLMEAQMSLYHLRYRQALAMAREGRLGELRFIHADFTFPAGDAGNYRWRPELGGGSLLDVGGYCLAPILELAGSPPRRLAATATMAESGVDSSFAGWLDFGGLAATFMVSFEAPESQVVELTGTRARLRIEKAFTAGSEDKEINLKYANGTMETFRSAANDPYLAMVEHFAAVVNGQEPERPSPKQSIRVLSLIDRLRRSARMESVARARYD